MFTISQKYITSNEAKTGLIFKTTKSSPFQYDPPSHITDRQRQLELPPPQFLKYSLRNNEVINILDDDSNDSGNTSENSEVINTPMYTSSKYFLKEHHTNEVLDDSEKMTVDSKLSTKDGKLDNQIDYSVFEEIMWNRIAMIKEDLETKAVELTSALKKLEDTETKNKTLEKEKQEIYEQR